MSAESPPCISAEKLSRAFMEPCELWGMLGKLLDPYEGELPRAIRADLFFHLNLAFTNPRKFHAKNLLYPAILFRGSVQPHCLKRASGGLMLVSDYAAEPGIGTFKPLLRSSGIPITLVVNRQVWTRCKSKLLGQPSLQVCAIDGGLRASDFATAIGDGRECQRNLMADVPGELWPLFKSASLVIQTLLIRSRLYQMRLQRLIEKNQPTAMVTHNDFTSLSYLAASSARSFQVLDVTMQHGIPSMEYFPTSASYYFTWGPKFTELMQQKAGRTRTRFLSVGAPRLDELAYTKSPAPPCAPKLRLLFLSQMQSPIFPSGHQMLALQLLRDIAALPGIELFIRAHPQDGAFWKREPAGKGVTVTPPFQSLKDSVLQSDAVASFSSTGMLEAALLGKPILQLETSAFNSRHQTVQFQHVARDAAELHDLLGRLRTATGLEMWLAIQNQTLMRLIANPGNGTASFWEALSKLNSSETRTRELIPNTDFK